MTNPICNSWSIAESDVGGGGGGGAGVFMCYMFTADDTIGDCGGGGGSCSGKGGVNSTPSFQTLYFPYRCPYSFPWYHIDQVNSNHVGCGGGGELVILGVVVAVEVVVVVVVVAEWCTPPPPSITIPIHQTAMFIKWFK